MKIYLKKARGGDETVLTELMGAFYKEDNMPFEAKKAERGFRQLLARMDLGQVWLIRVDGKVAGYIVLTYSFGMEFFGRDAFVDDFYLKPEFRKQGVGRYTLKEVEKFAAKQDLKALHMECGMKKPRVVAFYESLGFNKRDGNFLLSKKL